MKTKEQMFERAARKLQCDIMSQSNTVGLQCSLRCVTWTILTTPEPSELYILRTGRAIASAIRSCRRNGGKLRLEMRLSPVRASGGEGGGDGGTEDDTGIHFEGDE